MKKIFINILASLILIFTVQFSLGQTRNVNITQPKQDSNNLNKKHYTTVGEIEETVNKLRPVNLTIEELRQRIRNLKKTDSIFDIELKKMKNDYSTKISSLKDSIAKLKEETQHTNSTIQVLMLKVAALESNFNNKSNKIDLPQKNEFCEVITILLIILFLMLLFYLLKKNDYKKIF